MTELFIPTLIASIFIAGASGLIGSFLVLRKMTLLPDALSHVALPGIALGILFHVEPLLGGLGFLVMSVFFIWYLEHKTKLAMESVTGVLFVTALAVGALLIPETELLETFFGDIAHITFPKLFLQTILAIGVIVIAFIFKKRIVLATIAPELAITARVKPHTLELILLILITLTVTIGISFVGILLMSALSIIPAVTARNISSTLKEFFTMSIIIAILALISGLVLAHIWNLNSGITTVLVSAFFFCVSLLIKK